MLPIPIISGAVSIVKSLFGAGTDAIKGWSERKTMKAQHKINLEAVKQNHEITMAAAGQLADIQADVSTISQMSLTWKDEYLTLIFTIPAILAFIPGMADIVKDGFTALKETPQWYQALLILVAASGLGLRKFVDGLMNKLFGG